MPRYIGSGVSLAVLWRGTSGDCFTFLHAELLNWRSCKIVKAGWGVEDTVVCEVILAPYNTIDTKANKEAGVEFFLTDTTFLSADSSLKKHFSDGVFSPLLWRKYFFSGLHSRVVMVFAFQLSEVLFYCIGDDMCHAISHCDSEKKTQCLHPDLNLRGWLFLVNSWSYQKQGDCQLKSYNHLLWLIFLKNLGRSTFLLYLAGTKHIVSNQHLDFDDQTYWVGWYRRPSMI